MRTSVLRLLLLVISLFAPGVFGIDNAAAGNQNLYAHFHDQNMADFTVTNVTCGGEWSCTLTRGGVTVASWSQDDNGTVYASDLTTGMGTWTFTQQGYDPLFGEVTYTDTYTNTSNVASGTLHNELDWLNRLGRGAVSWSNIPNFYVGQVTVKGGIAVDNMEIRLQNDGSFIKFEDQLTVTNGLTIVNASAGDTSIIFSGLAGDTINDLTIDGTNKVEIRDSQYVQFDNLQFSPGSNLKDDTHFLNFAKVHIDNQSSHIFLSDSSVPYLRVEGNSSELNEVTATMIDIVGDDNIIKNSTIAGSVGIVGDANILTTSKITMGVVSQYGFDLSATTAVMVLGNYNQIAYNSIFSDDIVKSHEAINDYLGKHNIYAYNDIDAGLNPQTGFDNGIVLAGAEDPQVYGNTFTGVYLAAIVLNRNTNDAMIRQNTITGGAYGIVIEDAHDNWIMRNTIEYTENEGILVPGLSDTSQAKGAIIYGNNLLATDGITLGDQFEANNHPTVSNILLTHNVLDSNMVANTPAKVCRLYQVNPGVDGAYFYSNYVKPGCTPGMFRSRDDGINNTFYDTSAQSEGGNFWDNYTGSDGPDPDPFGDTPYPIVNSTGVVVNEDKYPLVFDTGTIQVAPSGINYGSVFIPAEGPAQSITQDVVITNTDAQHDLIVFALTVNGDHHAFRCGNSCNTPITLTAGSSHQVHITFAPEEVDIYNAVLNVFSNDSANSHVSVALQGTGVAPGNDVLGIIGRVTDGTFGILGITVEAYPSGNTSTPSITTETNVDGDYFLPVSENAQFYLRFNAEQTDYQSEWYNDVGEVSEATLVNGYTTAYSIVDDVELVSKVHTLTINILAGLGSIDHDPVSTIRAGEPENIAITPANNYFIESVSSSCGGVLHSNSFYTDPIRNDCTVDIRFDSTDRMTAIIQGLKMLSGENVDLPGYLTDINGDGVVGLAELIAEMQMLSDESEE